MTPAIDLHDVRVMCSNGRNVYPWSVNTLVNTAIILARVIVLYTFKYSVILCRVDVVQFDIYVVKGGNLRGFFLSLIDDYRE